MEEVEAGRGEEDGVHLHGSTDRHFHMDSTFLLQNVHYPLYYQYHRKLKTLVL